MAAGVIAMGAAMGALFAPGTASATVHEIVGQWCSGHEPLHPRGISGGSAADNFAQPLRSNGFVEGTVPFTGSAGAGLLIVFDFDHPASKVVGTGDYVVIGLTPGGPLYLERFELDPDFPAFQRCPRLVTG